MSGRWRARGWSSARLSGVAAVLAALVIVIPPPQVASSAAPPPTVTEATTEAAALSAARQQHSRVEVLAARTGYSETFALPNGRLLLQSHLRLQRVRGGDGSWRTPDATLRRGADGTVSPVAAVTPMSFSGGGTVPMASMVQFGRSMKLWWPGRLPVPVLVGNVARYTEVLPGVDLEIRVEPESFTHLLVIKTRAALASAAVRRLELRTELSGVSLHREPVTGVVTALDDKGTAVFTGATPTMWDSRGHAVEAGARPEARQSTVAVQLSAGKLALVPDAAMLADPAVEPPVYVDPTWTPTGAPKNHHTILRRAWPNNSYYDRTSGVGTNDATAGVIRVGANNYDGPTYVDRSMFDLNMAAARYKHINRAIFGLTQSWAGPGCGGASGTVNLHGTAAFNQYSTWNSTGSSWWGVLASTRAIHRYGNTCGPAWIEFDVTGWTAQNAAVGSSNLFVGLKGATEVPNSEWKRYQPNGWLAIEYNSVPNAPGSLSASGRGCGSSGAPTPVTTATPVLAARASDVDSGQQLLTTSFHWWPASSSRNGTDVVSQSTGNPGDPAPTVPAGRLTDGVTYAWQAVTRDDVGDEQWSGVCYFTVDALPPNPPGSVTSSAYPPTGFNGGVGIAGMFTFNPPATNPQEVVEYAYTLDLGVPGANAPRVAARTTDRKADVSVAPRWDGTNILRVWTVDSAGRPSTGYVDYTFSVTRGTGEVALWDLEASCGTADGSQHGNTLQITGATCVPGRAGVGSALLFDGVDDYAATAGQLTYPPPGGGTPVGFRTDASFTLTAWVKLPSIPTHNKPVVAIDGTRTCPFFMGYDYVTSRWVLRAHTPDVDAPAGNQVASTAAPVVGVWTHLAGVYDAQARTMRLYVNGVQQPDTITLNGAFNATGRLTIGQMKYAGVASHFFNATIDDVRVFQTVLDANQINLMSWPLKPAISFPNGTVADVGGSIAVRFDAGGDTNVTSYRYGIASDGATPLTATPPAPGQPVTVNVPVTTAGTVTVYARTVDATGDQSLVATAAFQGRAAASLVGVVRDAVSGAPLAGAQVRLDPGGLSTTSAANGTFSFPGIGAGTYTLAAVVGDRCALSAATLVTVLGPTTQDLFVAPMGDAFGYTCRIESQAFVPANTTVLSLTGDDAVAQVSLPFPVPFYESAVTTLWVDTNGYVSFANPGGSHPYDGTNIPAPSAPNSMVAAFWDDLVVDASASVRTATTGSAPNRKFVVEWRNVYRKGDTTARLTAEVLLGENGDATVNYSGLDTAPEKGEQAVVGIESPGGEVGIQYSFRQAVLANGTAVVFDFPGDPVPIQEYTLTGIVRDNATGSPVAGLLVNLAPAGRTATTAADGRYTFAGLEPGNYRVAAQLGTRCAIAASVDVQLFANSTVDLPLRPVTDGFGYSCQVRSAAFVPADGTVLPLNGDDNVLQVATPFPVMFYGQSYGSVHVSTNGFVALIPPESSYPDQAAPIPDAALPNGLVAAFWRDLVIDPASASVRTAVVGAAPNRRFVIEWREAAFFGNSTVKVTVEVIFEEGGDITLNYAGLSGSLEQGADAAVGLEDPIGFGGYEYSFAKPVLASGQSIVFHPSPQLPVMSGTVVDAVTGAPVAGATVSLGTGAPSATTAANGTYQLYFVPGNYSVSAQIGGPCGRAAEVQQLELVAPVTVQFAVARRVDGYGYTCEVTSTPFVPANTTVLTLTGDDVVAPLTLPFPVRLYGQQYTSIWVDTNGAIYVTNPGESRPDPAPMPNTAAPNGVIAPYWADLFLVDASATVRTTVVGTAPNRQFVIEWRDAAVFGQPVDKRVTVEVILHENGRITFNYASLDGTLEQGGWPRGTTAGIEDAAGVNGLPYVVNQPLLRNGEAITFIPPSS